MSLVFERKGDLLVCYLDPSGLVWNGYTYEKKNFSHAGETTFDVNGINSYQRVGLDKFRPDFVQFLYGRRFDQLPAEMREGDKKVYACLPPDGAAWPVARGDYGYGVSGYCHLFGSMASRGAWQKNVAVSNSAEKKGVLKRLLGW